MLTFFKSLSSFGLIAYVPACGLYTEEAVCDLYSARCKFDIYSSTCIGISLISKSCFRGSLNYNLTDTTVPCGTYSQQPSVCDLNPACTYNTSSLSCVNCPSTCGPNTTPCVQLNQSTCAAFNSRCTYNLANNMFVSFLFACLALTVHFRCADLPCSSVANRTDCSILSGCQWSITAQYCLPKGLTSIILYFIQLNTVMPRPKCNLLSHCG